MMSAAIVTAPADATVYRPDEVREVTMSTTDDHFRDCSANATCSQTWASNAQTLRAVMEANPRIRDHLIWWTTQLRSFSSVVPTYHTDNQTCSTAKQYFTVVDDHYGDIALRHATAFDGILFCWYICNTEDLASLDIPSEDDYTLTKKDQERINSITNSLERSKFLVHLSSRRMLADCFWLSPMDTSSRYSGTRCKNAMYISSQDNMLHISTAARGSNLTSDDVINVLSGQIVRQDMGWNLGRAPKLNQINLYLPLNEVLALMQSYASM